MQACKTNTLSFGTKCAIDEVPARYGLPKYKKSLTNGIYGAFEDLSKNKNKDMFIITMGPTDASKETVDDIGFFYVNKKGNLKSSFQMKVQTLANKTEKGVKKFVLDKYNSLKQSTKDVAYINANPVADFSKTKSSKMLDSLMAKFCIDDKVVFNYIFRWFKKTKNTNVFSIPLRP